MKVTYIAAVSLFASVHVAFAQVVPDVFSDKSSTCVNIVATRLFQSSYYSKDVFTLQKFLKSRGLFTATPNGIYGPSTIQAVKSYQESRGVDPATGIVGMTTRALVLLDSCLGVPVSASVVQGNQNSSAFNPSQGESSPSVGLSATNPQTITSPSNFSASNTKTASTTLTTSTTLDFTASTSVTQTATTATTIITEIYQRILGRVPDAAGLAFYVDLLTKNLKTKEQIEADISLSDEKYLIDLYKSELGRAPDTAGLAFYMDQLAKKLKTRAQVKADINASSEAVAYRKTSTSVSGSSSTTATTASSTISLLSPKSGNTYSLGSTIPIGFVTDVKEAFVVGAKNKQVRYTINPVSVNVFGGVGVVGVSGFKVIPFGKSTNSISYTTGTGHLELPGVYEVSVQIVDCGSFGCGGAYAGKAISTVSSVKITMVATGTSTVEIKGPYRAYLNGSTYANIATDNITKAKALESCTLNKNSNPSSSIRCTWNGEEILNSSPASTASTTSMLTVAWGPQSNTPFNAGTSWKNYAFGSKCYSWTTIECGSSNIQTTGGRCAQGLRYSVDYTSGDCSTTTPSLGSYKAYLGGSTYANIATDNITKAKALESCTLNKNSNPSLSIRCTWNGEEILNFTPAPLYESDQTGNSDAGPSSDVVGSVFGASISAVCTNLPINLHRGMEKPSVSLLQSFLLMKGLMEGEVTGFYGDKTVQAVKDYQESAGLPVTGMVYDFTREAIKAESCR